MTFRFVAEPAQFRPEGFVARVPSGLSGKARLMEALASSLQFPAHFGGNWDALADCLRDLSWLPSGKKTLIHEGLPDLPELAVYLELLNASALEAVFAVGDRARVRSEA